MPEYLVGISIGISKGLPDHSPTERSVQPNLDYLMIAEGLNWLLPSGLQLPIIKICLRCSQAMIELSI